MVNKRSEKDSKSYKKLSKKMIGLMFFKKWISKLMGSFFGLCTVGQNNQFYR